MRPQEGPVMAGLADLAAAHRPAEPLGPVAATSNSSAAIRGGEVSECYPTVRELDPGDGRR